MTDFSDREIARLYEVIDSGFKGVHDRLDALNGRTREAEKQIAVLEDRATATAKKTAAYGAGAGTAIVAVVEAIKAWAK